MVRKVIGIVLGVLVGMIVMQGVESLSHAVHKPLDLKQLNTQELIDQYFAELPLLPMLLIALGHFLGSFVGNLIGFFITKERALSLIPSGVILLGSVVMVAWLKPPTWFVILDLLMPVTGAIVAWSFMKKKVTND